jgi:signal transduction histidine kinase
MVQRRASDPTEVVRLARRQERELRDWLFAGQPGAAVMTHGTVGAALADLAHELEELHGVPVDVVQVRDVAVGPLTAPLLQAAREAIVNAQRHSGAAVVSVFCEIEPDAVVIYVRDRGCGFDGDSVERDRRGIADSIVGRLARHGGVATVRSTPGEGTEVMMRAPLEAS